ncbi:FadR/GntR family transcriptional regulator [Microbacterium sp. 10M-3C3]|jgi:GntR family transcriptional repressor for pyruvate dehydrogenase complex|uniref:FadR/GntR family transcriptional regulator n=1 Tax=Microbacterium sp. 10M-3C3 TaxID=2483401 RepID=UPI000F62D26A|nr:FadR/GntR family transcriptional regulator [Microbacterium sp. 10M-3C3]
MDWSSLRRSTGLSVPDRLALDLERAILDGELRPGDRLPNEHALSAELGVSRVSVRQALHELEQRGLLDRRPGRGTVVQDPAGRAGDAGASLSALLEPTPDGDLARIMELRAVVEPPIAALAAVRVRPRDVAQLRALVADMEAETDLARYGELDRAFHQAIAQYTHNPLLAQLTALIADHIAPARRSDLQTPERRRTSTAAHRLIVDAVAVHDGPAAEAAARAHVHTVREHVLHAADTPHRRTDGVAPDQETR